MAITSLQKFKDFLTISASVTTNDVAYQMHLDAAEAVAKRYCGRDFTSQAYTEFYDGTGTSTLPLRQRPVSAVSSVYLDCTGFYGDGSNAFASTTLLTVGTDYVLKREGGGSASKSGLLYRLGYGTGGNVGWYPPDPFEPTSGNRPTLTYGRGGPVWPKIAGCIKVTYTAGYTTADMPDVIEAIHMLAALTFRTKPFGGSQPQAENLGSYGYQLMQGVASAGMAPEIGTIRQKLAAFREIPI